MPFTSVTGASSVIKPGVVTSSTRPSAPYVGQLIFETDTNRLAVYNGSSWIMLADADTPPGLELIKTQTIGSAVSSVTVSDVFSNTYQNYKVILSGDGFCSTSSVGRLTFGSATSNYYWGVIDCNTSGTVTGAGAGGSAYIGYITSGTTNNHNGIFDILNPYNAVRTMVAGSTYAIASGVGRQFTGYHDDAGSYTSFTLTASTGTMTGGTIRVYGYRNS